MDRQLDIQTELSRRGSGEAVSSRYDVADTILSPLSLLVEQLTQVSVAIHNLIWKDNLNLISGGKGVVKLLLRTVPHLGSGGLTF